MDAAAQITLPGFRGPLKALLIEDDMVDAMALIRAAANQAWPYLIDRAVTVADARRALTANRYDVILAD